VLAVVFRKVRRDWFGAGFDGFINVSCKKGQGMRGGF